MCGFSGFIGAHVSSSEDWSNVLTLMGNTIRHRGPDDSGFFVDKESKIGMVHRRLSIVDLSPSGHQPMISACGRYVIVFNGEIYNHLELRKILSSQTSNRFWRSQSDTETLLASFEVWGVESTLKKLVGMFAFAVWDTFNRELIIARDRLGEKPLYYGWQQGVFLFGSELKALKAHPAFLGEINRDAVALQLLHNYIPAPYSIYKGIHKLTPGSLMILRPGHESSEQVTYWSLLDIAAQGTSNTFTGSNSDAVLALEAKLKESIALQMVADVPIGAFLSGGVDSSVIVALMQAQSTCAIRTFTIGFDEKGFNEAEHAMTVAKHLGTEHTELYVTSRQAMEVIPSLPLIYDEPFSDSSQIPTYLVSRMTRQNVTVALSGDGGDELFGGYSRYLRTDKTWRAISSLPHTFRFGLSRAIRSIPVGTWNNIARPVGPFLPIRMRNVGDKMHKFASLMNYEDQCSFYQRFLTLWNNPEDLVYGSMIPPGYSTTHGLHNVGSYIESMMATDAIHYLPDDILVKVDRAAMAVSLETRVPFLDHRVVEFAWHLPLHMKIRNGETKWALKQVLYKYVPKKMIERPKMGFGVPIDSWLRGPLRDWAENLLDESRLRSEGFFDPVSIREKWTEHLSGIRNWQSHLWAVLMFQAWLENERSN